MIEFSERLREARKLRNLTQEQLAEKADVSRVMITRYECGQVIPTVEVLVRLADALHISIDDLLGRKGFFSSHDNLTSAAGADALHTIPPQPNAAPVPEAGFPQNLAELRAMIIGIFHEMNEKEF